MTYKLFIANFLRFDMFDLCMNALSINTPILNQIPQCLAA